MTKHSIKAWIHGAAMTPFARRHDMDFVELGQYAVRTAIDDAGVSPESIQEFYCGTGYGGPLAGQRILGPLGLSGPRVVNVENACSSGMSALALGVEAIMSKRADTVVVLGVDKLSALGNGPLPLESSDIEVQQGLIMPAVYAMRAQRYLHETGATIDDLAAVSVKARWHGSTNHYAQMRTTTTVDEVLSSRPIADPLTLFMCCPRGDGAAAVVLSSQPPDSAKPAIGFKAVTLLSGKYNDGYRDMTRSELSERTIASAYQNADLGPEDIDVAETHDAFAIAEIMYYEALGFADRGYGWKLVRDGSTGVDGKVAVNPSGGLLARGHPVGATGVAQICEGYFQLTGEADNQVDGVENVIAHCTGGGIAGFDHGACGVAIFGRPK